VRSTRACIATCRNISIPERAAARRLLVRRNPSAQPERNINFGWAHADATIGDPARQHPRDLGADNASNLFTIAFKHAIDRHVSWYFDWAETSTIRGLITTWAPADRITTDCHDATTLAAFDPTANGGAGGVTGGRTALLRRRTAPRLSREASTCGS